MKKMRKILIWTLIAALTAALAAPSGQAVSRRFAIESVSVTITEPKAGGSAPQTAEVPEDAHYTVEKVTWYKSPDGEAVSTFTNGDQFYAAVDLTAESSYHFTSAPLCEVNGDTAVRMTVTDGDHMTVYYLFEPLNSPVLHEIWLYTDFSNLIVGNDADRFVSSKTEPRGIKFTFNSGSMYYERYDTDKGDWVSCMDSNRTVLPGVYRYVYHMILNKNHAQAASDCVVYVNGSKVDCKVSAPREGYTDYYISFIYSGITPQTLPALSGTISYDTDRNPVPAGTTVRAVLGGGLENMDPKYLHYEWQWKTEDDGGVFGSKTEPTYTLPDDVGELRRVRVSAYGYSGFVYGPWIEIGPATTSYTVTYGWDEVWKNLSKQAGETVEISAPVADGYTFLNWEVTAGSVTLADPNAETTTFKMPAENVTIRANYSGVSAQPNPFVDVSASDVYYDAVLWAYYAKPQVTNGMDDTHFGPKQTVTRGQCAAFLWRAMGEPEPTSTNSPFVDVPSWQYYYKPILWAVENGITKGTDATHFSPDQTLSTAHIITFLYRTKNPGKDGWYEPAAAWAGSGYDGRPFGVNTPVNESTNCPRGYVVMFLQKAK